MKQQVKIIYPHVIKERIRDRIQRLFPYAYEKINILFVRRNDRRYHRLQQDIFEQLKNLTGKPSDIEIETINKCNSTCGFCPVNRYADTRQFQRMSRELFCNIIDQLSEWNYDRVLKLYSNNEPFLDKRIFEFTEYAREKLPKAFLKITTNGTALNVEKVDRILPLLSQLVINDYGTDTSYVFHEHIQKIIDHVNTNHPDLAPRLAVAARRLTEVKTTRAGTAPNRMIKTITYHSRCAYPFFQMVIRPDGKVSLCCNDALGQMTLGDVSSDSIRDVWHSNTRREIQESMCKSRDQIQLCAGCDYLGWAKPKRIARAIDSGNFKAYL